MLIRVSSLTFREVNERQKKKKRFELDYHFTTQTTKRKNHTQKKNNPSLNLLVLYLVPKTMILKDTNMKNVQYLCDTLKVLVNI